MYFPIIDALKESYIAKIPSIVTQWLTDNVNPVGSAIVVDESLSISGAAADAKITGDEISNLKSDLSEISENKTNLYTADLLQIGTNWFGGTSADRAVAYVAVKPSTTYLISIPTNAHITAVQAIEKAQNTGTSGNLHLTGIVGGKTAIVTTTENTNYFCLQFDGNKTLASTDFENYDVYVCEGKSAIYSAVDKVARQDIAMLLARCDELKTQINIYKEGG